MEDDLDGFRYSMRFPPSNTGTEMTEVIVLAVARRQDDAAALARGQCPRQCSAKLIGSGPSVLDEARRHGLKKGQATTLSMDPSI